jgi:hypothetical protein
MSFCLLRICFYLINKIPAPSKRRLAERSTRTTVIFALCFGNRRSINFTRCIVNLHSGIQVYNEKVKIGFMRKR